MIQRFVPLCMVLIAVALFFGYINPTYTGAVADVQTDIDGYTNALLAAKTFSDKKIKLEKQKEGLSPEGIKRLEVFLPDGVDNVQLILDLDALAKRSGVKLSDFEMDVTDDKTVGSQISGGVPLGENRGLDSLTLGVTAVGTYGAFRSFLSGVENSLRPLDLVAMRIADVESNTGVYTYDMLFTIYWLR